MDLMHLAAAILLVSSPGETVLLDFRADYCGPCRQMDPIIGQFASEGYPVRKVNIDEPQNQALASKFGVQGIPCFVLLVDGKEVDRVVGATDRSEIEKLFRKAGLEPGAKSVRGQSPETSKPQLQAVPFPSSDQADRLTQHENESPVRLQPPPKATGGQYDHLIRASVRLRIEDEKGSSRGSGTIIDAREGEALILTCGHVFRDAAKDGQIVVDFFGPGAPQGLPGKLVAYDLKSDVGLLSVATNYPVSVAHLAPSSVNLKRGDAVISVGCDGGADATARETQVTSINRYVEPKANIQVAFQPVQGRSGGGLFTPEGWVVGVCNAADPQDNEGLFAGLPVVQEELDKLGLSFVYRDMPTGQHAVADGRLQAEIRNQESGIRSRESMVSPPKVATRSSLAHERTVSNTLSVDEQAALEMLHAKSEEAEVVCIIRPKGNPNAKSEIIVLDRTSPDFVKQLSSGREPRGQQRLTSLESSNFDSRLTQSEIRQPLPSTSSPSRSSEVKSFKIQPWWTEGLK